MSELMLVSIGHASGEHAPVLAPETTGGDQAPNLEGALREAIALARQGEWVPAEMIVHAYLRTLPADALPRAYIESVEIVARLLTAGAAAGRPRRAAEPPATSSRPRLLLPRDPAWNYAHAVLTALRGRLAG